MRGAGSIILAAAVLTGWACKQQPRTPPAPRAELRAQANNTFEIVPVDGSLPRSAEGDLFCLVFTRSESGVIRQLTMTHENKSMRCEPGKPIGNVTFRVPPGEGAVKVHVFLSDQKLNAGSIAEQLYESRTQPTFQPMDLRVPGNVAVQTLEFAPAEGDGTAPTLGGRIGASGEILPPPQPDAGATPTPVAADDAGTAGAP